MCFYYNFVCLRSVSCAQCCLFLCIVQSVKRKTEQTMNYKELHWKLTRTPLKTGDELMWSGRVSPLVSDRGKVNICKREETYCHSKFPFISSIIPASPTGVYISQLIPYNRACAQYTEFLDSAQLLTQKLLKQGYVAPWLKSSLQLVMLE
jgi:hypothetical protein